MDVQRVDVAVIGGGPAGIAAAVTAAHDASVMLIDNAPRPGGQIWRHTHPAGLPARARQWLERLADAQVELWSGTAVVDAAVHGGHVSLLVEGERATRVDCGAVILATGARELFLPFPGWTLPGVYGVGGAQALLKGGLDVRGRRVVIAGSGPLMLPVAAAFVAAGAAVIEVLEQAPRRELVRFGAGLLMRSPARIAEAVRLRRGFAGVPFRTGTWVTRADGAAVVEAVHVTDGGRERVIECDMLCTGYGLVPAVELARVLGCAVEHGRVRVGVDQQTSLPQVYAAGEPTGIGGVDAALVEGRIAGLAAVRRAPPVRLVRERDAAARFAMALERTFTPRAELLSLADLDTIVCRCEDVKFAHVAGCGSARDAKLMTRAGMGACQARVCGPALQAVFGWAPDTVRTPLFPTRIETMMATGEQYAEE